MHVMVVFLAMNIFSSNRCCYNEAGCPAVLVVDFVVDSTFAYQWLVSVNIINYLAFTRVVLQCQFLMFFWILSVKLIFTRTILIGHDCSCIA